MKNKLVYAVIETQEDGDFEGRNLIGIYSTEDRAEKEVAALEEVYEENGHTYEVECFTVDGHTWLDEEVKDESPSWDELVDTLAAIVDHDRGQVDADEVQEYIETNGLAQDVAERLGE